jgi:hypothetical protein
MANRLYPLARQSFAEAQIDWTSDTIRIAALKSTYTYSATHQFVTDLGANIVARSADLSTKTDTSGVLNSDAALFALLTGLTVQYLAVFQWTGSDATSRLLYYIDTGINLPTIPNGLDVTVQPDPTTGWFQV